MQIQLDPKQMDYLRRQAEAMEKIAVELTKLRKLMQERSDQERRQTDEGATD
jgi:hypothetical protein